MSHAALVRLDILSGGERLVAFSLASFANREHRAWPSTPVAAAGAQLSRSQYLAARNGLVQRGLVDVEEPGGGRGRSAVIFLRFAATGPWADVEVNPGLVEAVLAHSRAQGAARVLLVTLAAVADQDGAVVELSTTEAQAAAGIANSTYRRARANLLASGELRLAAAGGGRARTNRWIVPDPASINPSPIMVAQRRCAPAAGTRPLLAAARGLGVTSHEQPELIRGAPGGMGGANQAATTTSGARAVNHGHDRTVSQRKGPGSGRVSWPNPAQSRAVPVQKGPGLTGVSKRYPAQDRTVNPETPPQTPPPNARAGREPQNPRTTDDPPSPLQGGHDGAVSIIEDRLTANGRRRRRTVLVDLDQARSRLPSPTPGDRDAWQRIRADLEAALGAEMFAIWLAELQPITRDGGTLVLACPAQTRAWVSGRYGALLDRVSGSHARRARLCTDSELQLYTALQAAGQSPHNTSFSPDPEQEAV